MAQGQTRDVGGEAGTNDVRGETPERSMLVSRDAATGRLRGRVPANTPEEVRSAVARARRSASEWAGLPVRGRVEMVREVRYRIRERLDDLLETISAENGKPGAEALAHDVFPTVLTLAYLERIAPRALRPEPVGQVVGTLLGMRSRIEWRPFGVVGCITPWNYPMLLSFMAITPALLAGNAVVLKPSEMTPGVGERMREVLEPLPPGVCTVVQGGAEIGRALVDARCDKLCFIGSAATGRRIAEAAARHLTPLVMELGGQDSAIVCEDADLDFAASGVLWGAFLNAGQACCAIERVYVVESVAVEFERLLVEKLRKLHVGGPEPDIGPLTTRRQHEVVRRHVADAVDKGATVLAGGPQEAGDGSEPPPWYPPTVLRGRSGDMAMFREETFGPVLPIVRVRDEDEAVRRANQDGVNLTASVWTRDRRRGREIARRIDAGSVLVNDHAASAGAPWGLWGGVGESGYGRLHGTLGLREFSVPVHIAANSMPWMKRLWWYPYDRPTNETLRAAVELISSRSWADRARAAKAATARALGAVKGKI